MPDLPVFWQEAAPGTAGIAADVGRRLEAATARGEFPGLHALLILRHGRLALERYFPGRDQCWGRDLGLVQHGPAMLHDMRSITKSIVSELPP